MPTRSSPWRSLFGSLVLVFAAMACDALAQKKNAPENKRPTAGQAKPAGKPAVPAVGAATDAGSAAKKSLDLTFVASRHVAAVVLHPQQAIKSPQVQTMPIEILEATLKQEAGIDLKQVEEVVMLVGISLPPMPAYIVRFNEPCRQQEIIEALTVGEGDKIGDQTTYRVKGGDPLVAAFPDDHTLLVGTNSNLTEMLGQKDAAGPLIDHLRAVDASETLSAVVVVEPIRPLLKGALTQLSPLPPQYQQFAMLADLLAALELHVSGEAMAPSLVLEGIGPGETTRIDHLLDRAIEFATAAMEHRATQLAADDPGPVSEATGRYLKRMLKTAFDAVERKQTENRLTVTLRANPAINPSLATNGVLVALLLPAVQSARTAARQAQSINNLKQIGLAMHNHHDVFNAFPARAIFKNGKPLLSWRVAILPFVEQKALYDQFHLDEPWDSEHNRKLIERMPPVYANPKLDPKLVQAGKTNYLAPTGPATMFNGEKGATFQIFKDGTSNTLMVVEADADRAVVWTAPDDLEIDPADPRDGLGHFQPGVIMALFVDGHVSRLPAMLDAETFSNLFNPADGNVVQVE